MSPITCLRGHHVYPAWKGGRCPFSPRQCTWPRVRKQTRSSCQQWQAAFSEFSVIGRRTKPTAKEEGCYWTSLLKTEAGTEEVTPVLPDEHDHCLGKTRAWRLSESWGFQRASARFLREIDQQDGCRERLTEIVYVPRESASLTSVGKSRRSSGYSLYTAWRPSSFPRNLSLLPRLSTSWTKSTAVMKYDLLYW